MAFTSQDLAAIGSRSAFGAVLAPQGRGYYVTLELLALLWGTVHHDDTVLPTPTDQKAITVQRRGHDFARRWMSGNHDDVSADERGFVIGHGAEEILRALLESLRVPIPNRRSIPTWGGQHLYPYVGELIHYDAVPRRNRDNPVSIERYTYRGAGGLAHMILRSDPDEGRLQRNRRGLRALVADSGGPLGKLADACAAHDRAEPASFTDEREADSLVLETKWVDVLRDGVANITSRTDLARSKQVEMLMHFVPFCLARHQLDRSCLLLEEAPFVFPVAIVTRPSPIRQISRHELDRARGMIDRSLPVAISQYASKSHPEDPIQANEIRSASERSRTWRNNIVSFFAGTMATVGALNAHTGSRYVTIRLPLLEALVCSSLRPGEEMEFEDFCGAVLMQRLGLVADRRSASSVGLTDRIDAGEFIENESQLAQDLLGLGMMREYSDATRMVHGEVA
jgi:hypothetical protein